MRVLVTGATGFVGRRLVPTLEAGGHTVVAASRANGPELGPEADWRSLLTGCDAVVHLAARVHVMKDTAADPLAAFRRANVDGTRSLAAQALDAGVTRFVYLSSVKAEAGDPYGLSKHEAEQVLAALPLRLTVLRPPLVYGPGVKANFLALLKLVDSGLPLPFGRVDNRRSLIAVGNLADAVRFCLENDVTGIHAVTDGAPVSTPDLIRAIAAALGRRARLLPVPVSVMTAVAGAVGRRALTDRLFGSLVADDASLRAAGWAPPQAMAEALAETAAWWRAGA